jgi:hypothetical protein
MRSVTSMGHLLNLRSPTLLEYQFNQNPNQLSVRGFRLLGPNGSFSFRHTVGSRALFSEFPLLPLNDIRTFHLKHHGLKLTRFYPTPSPTTFSPSSFPALVTFAMERVAVVSHFLSVLFSNPSSSPSLNTLAFLDCGIDNVFMEELTRYSFNRKNTTSARLRRVIIVDSGGQLPDTALIEELRKHVLVVDVRVGKKLPSDPTVETSVG